MIDEAKAKIFGIMAGKSRRPQIKIEAAILLAAAYRAMSPGFIGRITGCVRLLRGPCSGVVE